MKQLVLVLCLFALCCAPPVRPAVSPVTEANAVTVALMVPRGDAGEYGPVCAGVWVGDEWILTTNHCVTDDDEAPVAVMRYIANPAAKLYDSAVVYRDEVHDLALLRAKTAPMHTVAPVARVSPLVGDVVHVVGHPIGFVWTYLTGQVSGVLRTDSRLPRSPLMQVQCPVVRGNSGGGAFDEGGQLVGIADLQVHQLEGEAFFTPVEVIVLFLQKSHVL